MDQIPPSGYADQATLDSVLRPSPCWSDEKWHRQPGHYFYILPMISGWWYGTEDVETPGYIHYAVCFAENSEVLQALARFIAEKRSDQLPVVVEFNYKEIWRTPRVNETGTVLRFETDGAGWTKQGKQRNTDKTQPN